MRQIRDRSAVIECNMCTIHVELNCCLPLAIKSRSSRSQMYVKLSRLLRQPAYPWLLVAYAVLYLYSANIGLVIDVEAVLVLFVQLTAMTIAYLILTGVLRDRYKSRLHVGRTFFSDSP